MKRTQLELTVERSFTAPGSGAPTVARLTSRFEVEPGGGPASPEEIAEALRRLSAELDAAIPGPSAPPRKDRDLAELIEAYRPRQPELIELLREEGALTPVEYGRLKEFLSGARAATPVPPPGAELPGEPPLRERPIAAAPLAQDRTPAVARPVGELLALYHIESVKQAGAVRARRQISFEEYMAIKAHFARAEVSASGAAPP